METKQIIQTFINDSIEAKKKMLSEVQIVYIQSIANKIIEAYQNNKKLIIFGNGGSASDALHFAAEIVCRFEKNRKAIPAIALTENISSITAIGNDFGYDQVFSRQLEAFAQKGDIAIAITIKKHGQNSRVPYSFDTYNFKTHRGEIVCLKTKNFIRQKKPPK
jgi:D-sedoheptulose 7-phosphate isomerase